MASNSPRVLVIHCTRQKVTQIALIIGKLIINAQGAKAIDCPRWIERMYHAAKVEEYRRMWSGGNRMVTHYYNPQGETK
jgi:hypothetical protein